MKFTSKNKNKNKANSEGWGLGLGMGFLLIFFPEEQHQHQQPQLPQQNPKKGTNFNLFSISRFNSNSNSSNLLLHKAQSTISICLLLLFATALLFTLSTLPSSFSSSSRRLYRRQPSHQFPHPISNLSHALQKMGKLYRRGTRPMNDLVVAHAPPSLSPHEFKLFLRFFYRSTLAARSDLVFILPAKSSHLDDVVLQENDFFLRLLDRYGENKLGNDSVPNPVAHFLKLGRKEKEVGEPIWGKRSNKANFSEGAEVESNQPSYGSVVAFDVDELDPENTLSGFLDHVPMSLRRWACYPMLLGRVRRNFKHVTLIDVKEMLLLGDPLGRFRSQSPDSVHLRLRSSTHSTSGKHARRSPTQTRPKPVHPGIITGGSKGIRRLSNEMLTVIVRASMQQQQRKKKNPITESGLLSQLAENDYVLKHVNLEVNGESVPELSSLHETSLKAKSGMKNYTVVRRGNTNNLDFNYLMKYLCSFSIDSTVYSDC